MVRNYIISYVYVINSDFAYYASEQIFKHQINFYSDQTSCQKTIQFLSGALTQ